MHGGGLVPPSRQAVVKWQEGCGSAEGTALFDGTDLRAAGCGYCCRVLERRGEFFVAQDLSTPKELVQTPFGIMFRAFVVAKESDIMSRRIRRDKKPAGRPNSAGM